MRCAPSDVRWLNREHRGVDEQRTSAYQLASDNSEVAVCGDASPWKRKGGESFPSQAEFECDPTTKSELFSTYVSRLQIDTTLEWVSRVLR